MQVIHRQEKRRRLQHVVRTLGVEPGDQCGVAQMPAIRLVSRRHERRRRAAVHHLLAAELRLVQGVRVVYLALTLLLALEVAVVPRL